MAICGNGTLESGEECDDANTSSGDGCSDICEVAQGFACSGTPSECVLTCGDEPIQPLCYAPPRIIPPQGSAIPTTSSIILTFESSVGSDSLLIAGTLAGEATATLQTTVVENDTLVISPTTTWTHSTQTLVVTAFHPSGAPHPITSLDYDVGILFVKEGGSGGTGRLAPFGSLDAAIDVFSAQPGDYLEIRIAEGFYALSSLRTISGAATILGGYSTSDWESRDPSSSETYISGLGTVIGANLEMGTLVVNPGGSTSILDGFTLLCPQPPIASAQTQLIVGGLRLQGEGSVRLQDVGVSLEGFTETAPGWSSVTMNAVDIEGSVNVDIVGGIYTVDPMSIVGNGGTYNTTGIVTSGTGALLVRNVALQVGDLFVGNGDGQLSGILTSGNSSLVIDTIVGVFGTIDAPTGDAVLGGVFTDGGNVSVKNSDLYTGAVLNAAIESNSFIIASDLAESLEVTGNLLTTKGGMNSVTHGISVSGGLAANTVISMNSISLGESAADSAAIQRAISFSGGNVLIDGNTVFSLADSAGGQSYGIELEGGGTKQIVNNIVSLAPGNAADCAGVQWIDSAGLSKNLTMRNNIVFSDVCSVSTRAAIVSEVTQLLIDNNTLFLEPSADVAAIETMNSGAGVYSIRNNIVRSDVCFIVDWVVNSPQVDGNNYTCSDCATSADCGGASNTVEPVDGATFVNTAVTDFHLAPTANSALRTGALDLSAEFDTDLDGSPRTTGWSKGAYEF